MTSGAWARAVEAMQPAMDYHRHGRTAGMRSVVLGAALRAALDSGLLEEIVRLARAESPVFPGPGDPPIVRMAPTHADAASILAELAGEETP